jgi:hypothetical protein
LGKSLVDPITAKIVCRRVIRKSSLCRSAGAEMILAGKSFMVSRVLHLIEQAVQKARLCQRLDETRNS